MKKNTLIVIIVVLLCVNVGQCFMLLRANRGLANARAAADQGVQSYYTALQSTQKLWEGYAKLDPVKVGRALAGLDLPQAALDEKCVTVFLAPYVCGACVDEQCDALTELLESGDAAGIPIRFLCPQFKAKDLKAIFATRPSVKIQTYDYDLLHDRDLLDLNDVLYFANTEEGIRHIMLTVKGMPELTSDYLNLTKTLFL
jgi:hypothetical protein